MINLAKLRCLRQLSMRSRFFAGDEKGELPGIDGDILMKDVKTELREKFKGEVKSNSRFI